MHISSTHPNHNLTIAKPLLELEVIYPMAPDDRRLIGENLSTFYINAL